MNHRIYVENEQDEITMFRGYKSALRRAAALALTYEEFPRRAEISITLIPRERIREENRAYRGIDRETDVLSFPMTEDFNEIPAGDLDEGYVLLGDVLICPDVIRTQAKEFGTQFEEELALMAIHSVLHLIGYDHMSPAEKEDMFARQEAVLEKYKESAMHKEKN